MVRLFRVLKDFGKTLAFACSEMGVVGTFGIVT